MDEQNRHKLTQLYSFLFYCLSMMVGLFNGGLIVAMTGIVKTDGLAAGATAAVYALGTSFVSVLISIWLAYVLSRRVVIILNWILLIILLIHIGLVIQRFMQPNQADLFSLASSSPAQTNFII